MKSLLLILSLITGSIIAGITLRHSGFIPSTNFAIKTHPDPGNVISWNTMQLITPGSTNVQIALPVDLDNNNAHDGIYPCIRIYITDIACTFLPQNDAFYGRMTFQIVNTFGDILWTFRSDNWPDNSTTTGESTYHARDHLQTPIVMDVSDIPLYLKAYWEFPTTTFGAPEILSVSWLGRYITFP